MAEWKSIPEFPRYEVSDFGEVRFAGGARSDGRVYFHGKPHPLVACYDSSGYRHVNLYDNGRSCRRRIGRVVLMAFTNRNEWKEQCNHRNGLRDDDRLENLEWATSSENNFHRYRVLDCNRARGEQNAVTSLTSDQVLEMRRMYAAGVANQPELAAHFGVRQNTVSRIVNKKTWSHIA